jgi:hypothetical protein
VARVAKYNLSNHPPTVQKEMKSKENGSSILNVNENIHLRSEVNRLKEAIQCALVLIVNKPDEETKMAYDHLDDTLYSLTDQPKRT